MNKLSFKKLIPGLVSVIIIIGMAAQSFATNVDMAAFVPKDKYMTKYYELDWRIDQIENKLINLYQFTCTNVRTFAGVNLRNSTGVDLYRNTAYTYNNGGTDDTTLIRNFIYPTVILNKAGYLTVNTPAAINASNTTRNHWQHYEKSIPASLCTWMDGIEPAENCMITAKYSTYYNGATYKSGITNIQNEIIMGPFKKFKYPAQVGTNYSYAWVVLPYQFGVPGKTADLVNNPASSPTSLQYAENSLTKPTTWTNLATNACYPYMNSGQRGYTGLYVKFNPTIDYDDYPSVAFSPEEGSTSQPCITWNSAVPNTSLEGKTNVWLRFFWSNSSITDYSLTTGMNAGSNTVITSWNNNK